MSLVADQVRRLDAQFERFSLFRAAAASLPGEGAAERPLEELDDALASPRFKKLLRVVKALSLPPSSGALLSSKQVETLLLQSGLTDERDLGQQQQQQQQRQQERQQSDLTDLSRSQLRSQYESEIEWLLVGKAAVQTYGLILNTLLDQIVPLSDDLWYWDEVLSSYTSSCYYLVQTSPLRLWNWSRLVYEETRAQLHRPRHVAVSSSAQQAEDGGVDSDGHYDDAASSDTNLADPNSGFFWQWDQFYSIVRHSIMERSITDLRRRILSPVALCRSEIRQKQTRLRKLREMIAAGLGILVEEGLVIDSEDSNGGLTPEWKGVVDRSVILMETVIRNVLGIEISIHAFEDKVFAGVEEDVEMSVHAGENDLEVRPRFIVQRLLQLLQYTHPGQIRAMAKMRGETGPPSGLVRLWFPTVVLLASSSTIFRILINRQDDIVDSIRNFGATIRDFWANWVIDPVRKIINTIRHDTNSEIALMSRDSLKADQDSLERMVVEFALDNPALAGGAPSLTEPQIAEIRAKVKEGDVTPVLKAYERDLRRPLAGTMRGDLVRSLLIQVQKTKVDLEVAISGIDALLKSQELVFGFVGLTPGVLVSYAMTQYLRTVLGSRQGISRTKRARRGIRVLRKIDKILTDATPTENNVISYKDHGLLLGEVHVLRQLAHGLLPADIEKEFIEDLDELANLRGIQFQAKALERIRWAYAEWLARMR